MTTAMTPTGQQRLIRASKQMGNGLGPAAAFDPVDARTTGLVMQAGAGPAFQVGATGMASTNMPSSSATLAPSVR
jgi:hypothetical protein